MVSITKPLLLLALLLLIFIIISFNVINLYYH